MLGSCCLKVLVKITIHRSHSGKQRAEIWLSKTSLVCPPPLCLLFIPPAVPWLLLVNTFPQFPSLVGFQQHLPGKSSSPSLISSLQGPAESEYFILGEVFEKELDRKTHQAFARAWDVFISRLQAVACSLTPKEQWGWRFWGVPGLCGPAKNYSPSKSQC